VTKSSFCAVTASQTGEDAIGTAGHFQTYVLIECPYPWAANVFDSAHIPAALRQLIAAVRSQRSVQFLAINRPATQSKQSATRLLIYDAINPLLYEKGSPTPLLTGYRGFEFVLDDLNQAVECLKSYWQGLNLGNPITHIKDVLICTHGMRDKCCARFGQPFYKALEQRIAQVPFSDVRVWRVSHIGGHRFAPTAIVVPEGRYYARLTVPALETFLTQVGSVSSLYKIYRGLGLLPKPLQILERQLFLHFGWDWLKYLLSYQVIEDNEVSVKALLVIESPEKVVTRYRAEVVRSRNPAHRIQTACNADCPYIPVQYSIAEFSVLSTHPSDSTASEQPITLSQTAITKPL